MFLNEARPRDDEDTTDRGGSTIDELHSNADFTAWCERCEREVVPYIDDGGVWDQDVPVDLVCPRCRLVL